jgi:hypothetical protein
VGAVHLPGVYSLERLHYGALQIKNTTNNTNNMKTIRITTLIAAALFTVGTALAQGGPNRCGAGCGGPPQTDEQRAARQEACQKANGGACLGQGQGQGWCQGNDYGNGQGNGAGKGQRRGPRDGSGPRGGGADCPSGN